MTSLLSLPHPQITSALRITMQTLHFAVVECLYVSHKHFMAFMNWALIASLENYGVMPITVKKTVAIHTINDLRDDHMTLGSFCLGCNRWDGLNPQKTPSGSTSSQTNVSAIAVSRLPA